MTNSFYNVSGAPVTGSAGASAVIRSEYSLIAAAFDKMPALTASTAVIVNAGGTALSNTTGTLALAGNFATTGAFNTTLAQGASTTLTLPLVSGTLATLAGTETLTNKTIGAPTITGTLTTQGLIDASGASAGQIKFPATQNPSADVNTLDDYEENTWTPSIGGNTTYTTQTGTYTKIGRMVFIRGRVTINIFGTGSATVLSGLPFTAAATPNGGVTVSLFTSIATAVSWLVGQVNAGATSIAFNGAIAAQTSASAVVGVFQNGALIEFSGWYESTG